METIIKYFLGIATTISTAGILWLVTTTHELDKSNELLEYKVDSLSIVLQDLSERIDEHDEEAH